MHSLSLSLIYIYIYKGSIMKPTKHFEKGERKEEWEYSRGNELV
jgi:hypothetical protein